MPELKRQLNLIDYFPKNKMSKKDAEAEALRLIEDD